MALTRNQRELANSLSRQAQVMPRARLLATIEERATQRFSEPRIGQFLLQFTEKNAEVARHLVDAFRTERFASALILSRTLLEGAARMCWVELPATDARCRDRALSVIAEGYRIAEAQGRSIPLDAKKIVAEVANRGLPKPPKFRAALSQLDKHERKSKGTPHWQSHYAHFDFTSGFVHPSLYGPIGSGGKPILLGGVIAINYGHQYFALGAQAVLRLVELPGHERRLLERFAAIKPLQQQELQRAIKQS